MRNTPLGALIASALFTLAATLLASRPAQGCANCTPVVGTCVTCSSAASPPECGACIADGTTCFDSVPAAERRNSVFMTSDGHDARSLTFAHLVGGVGGVGSIPGPESAVNLGYGGSGWLYYGTGSPTDYCAPAGGPPPAFTDPTMYHYPTEGHIYEDTFDHLDCYNGEIDRWYHDLPSSCGVADGTRVNDGEQAFFEPWHGAIFDLGGEGNRVVVFPYTDHPPLPCESFEYSVWLSDNPNATEEVMMGAPPDPTKWNPALLIRAFLQGWIPDNPPPADETAALNPDLTNPTMHDGIVQVFALPCGLTFRYASLVAGNNGNPSPACQFWSFDAELDAVAGLNENDTAICPDRDGDGYHDAACGGNDCNDMDPSVHPGAVETCASTRDLDCDGTIPSCPHGTACFQSLCVPECLEGACASGFTCLRADGGFSYCVPNACANVTCPAGQICGLGGCVDPCEGALCPVGQICRAGACLDPCAGFSCPTHQHCVLDPSNNPECVIDCTCAPCTAPMTCNMTTGRCESAGCDTFTCPSGEQKSCTGTTPTCIVPCAGVGCPVGQQCDHTSGNCVRDACFGVACTPGFYCSNGMCLASPIPDSGMPDVAGMDTGTHDTGAMDVAGDTGRSMDASVSDAHGSESHPANNNAGCACRTGSPASGRSSAELLVAFGAVASLVRRRRRRLTSRR